MESGWWVHAEVHVEVRAKVHVEVRASEFGQGDTHFSVRQRGVKGFTLAGMKLASTKRTSMDYYRFMLDSRC